MSTDKKFTAKEAAIAVLKKAEEILLKAEKTKHNRCVEHVKENSPEVKNPHAVCVAQGVEPEAWKKSEMEKAETGHEKGVHTTFDRKGQSAAGFLHENRQKLGPGAGTAKDWHKQKLSELRSMPKPKLTKDEKSDENEIGTKFEKMEGPENKIENQPAPQDNPDEKKENNNPPWGTDPGIKGHVKLAKFIGYVEARRALKKGAK